LTRKSIKKSKSVIEPILQLILAHCQHNAQKQKYEYIHPAGLLDNEYIDYLKNRLEELGFECQLYKNSSSDSIEAINISWKVKQDKDNKKQHRCKKNCKERHVMGKDKIIK
jgi:hypothetical protein